MSHLKFDTRDWKFILHEQYDLKQLLGLKKYADFDIETLDTVADEGIKFAIDVVAPINGPGDAEGCRVADGRVTAPKGYAEAWKKLGANGWNSAIHSPEFGGQGLPLFAMMPVFEAMNGAGQAFFMYSQLTSGAAHLVENFGSEKLKKLYCEKMYTARHERGRTFSHWVERNKPEWRIRHRIANRYPFDPRTPNSTSQADFFVYEKRSATSDRSRQNVDRSASPSTGGFDA
jgi:hypothetical protein